MLTWYLISFFGVLFWQTVFAASFKVKEEQSAGTYVGLLTGIDSQGTYCFTTQCGWSTLFSLNQQDGGLTTTTVIDRESLSSSIIKFTLSGSDSNQNNILEIISVEIEDMNDNNPIFSSATFTLDISEELQPQEYDLLSWSDRDSGENGKLKHAQIKNLPDQSWPFIPILRTSGSFQQVVLKVTGSLDREVNDVYQFTIEIQDNGYPPRTGTLDMTINVLDINDNTPHFKKDSFQFQVRENIAVPYIIHTFSAEDKDDGPNGDIRYSLSHEYSTAYFEIDDISGSLSLIADVDYEKCRSIRRGVKGFTIDVTARDMATSPRFSTVAVQIEVLDVNDNSPLILFYSPSMINSNTVVLVEDIPTNSYTATILVTDADSGVNGQFDVSIDGGDNGKFKLETTQGNVILTADKLDREESASYEIVIAATDKGQPSLKSTSTLYVDILDVNDNSPKFTQDLYNVAIPEDAAIDTLLLSVKAVDPDYGVNGTVSYGIVSQSSDLFRISGSGSISNTKKLDAEQQNLHILNISATDSGSPPLSSYATVEISVTDINDNSPVFDKAVYNCDVQESLSVGSEVCSVSATDEDGGVNGEILYSFSSGDGTMFTINPDTGSITLDSALDFETKSVYQIIVVASDKGMTPRTTNSEVVVNVVDVNDESPVFNPTSYSASIPENLIYASILQIHATDKDKNDVCLFELQSHSDKFSVSSTGVISNKVTLQYAASTVYTLTITVQDAAGNEAPAPATVSITVLQNSQDLPIFTEGIIKTTISESEPVGYLITTVAASTISNCDVTYSLDASPYYLSIDSGNGELSLKNKVDFETTPSITVNVIATCKGVQGQAIIQVEVLDSNDNSPVCTGIDDVYVKEDTTLGGLIYSCICSDADSGSNGEVSYSFEVSSPSVAINRNTGDITVTSSLDRETTDVLHQRVKVCDAGTPQLCNSYDLTIHVTDVNDNVPQFEEPLTFYVKEDVKLNHEIGKLVATDQDENKNSQLIFSAISDVPEVQVFSSGQIIVNKLLDFENIEIIFLKVRVEDQGTPSLSSEAIVQIHVEDTNDNKPEFTKQTYTFSVLENRDVPRELGQVFATDQDTGQNGDITFSLSDNRDMFSIDSLSGMISILLKLDHEGVANQYELTILASDSGDIPLRSQATVIVRVLDANDNAPIFSQITYSVVINEDVGKDQKIFQVSASDRDGQTNNQISYSITSGQTQFIIDSTSGDIITNEELDFEVKHLYNLTVRASDSGSPSLSSEAHVLISLSDVNDNPPVFETPVLEIGVVESTSPGTTLKKIEAADADSGNNGKITYSLTTVSDPDYFSLESSTGNLKLLKKLTFSASSDQVFTLIVTAVDHGTPPLSAIQTVKITVIDVNDNAPIFTDSITSANVQENSQTGTFVFEVTATDQDSGPAGLVNYNISSNFFNIDKLNGRVTVAGLLDHEATPQVLIKVCATDQASPVSEQLSVCKDVTVYVDDVNDNSPVFEGPDQMISVSEGTRIGGLITTIIATDADDGENGNVNFAITTQDPPNTVSINAATGQLILQTVLDYESTPGQYCVLTVTATDSGTSPLTSSKDFQIVVTDDNDNPPVFTNNKDQSSVFVSPLVKPGDVIFTVHASDADSGQNGVVSYSLINTSKFSINGTTGEIKINFEVSPSFSNTVLDIKATDGGQPTLSSTTRVKVEYRQDNTKPLCGPQDDIRVAEDETSYTSLLSIPCYDMDLGDRGMLKYFIVNGNLGGVFSVSEDGEISLTNMKLNYEMIELYNLVVLVEDGGTPSLKELFYLNILIENVNDESPLFNEQDVVIEINEDVGTGTLIGTVTASDADGSSLTYMIQQESDECDGYFNLNSNTGQITVAKQIESALTSCEITIICSDGQFTDQVKVTILIKDIDNQAPVFYSASSFTTNLQQPSIVGVVGATDADSGDTVLIYSIVQTKRSSNFLIDSQSGVISCPGMSCSSSTITVKASGRSLSTSKTINVDFSPTSLQPIFKEEVYSFIVNEDAAIDFIIGRIALLVDVSEVSSLTIEGGNYDISFSIDNLNLVVNNKLDFEKFKSYNLTLCATKSSVSTFASVVITVDDVNDNAPEFVPSSMVVQVNNNLLIGTNITQVTAVDLDSGEAGELLYYLEDSPMKDNFEIVATDGQIKLKKSLAGAPNEFSLKIKSKDQGSPVLTSNTLYLIIHILHVPQPPVFDASTLMFTAFADAPSYSNVGEIKLVGNQPDNFKFSFNRQSQYFKIFSTSGIIVQKSKISDNTITSLTEKVNVVSVFDANIESSVDVKFSIIQSICSPNPCINGGKCIDAVETYTCECLAGTDGRNCECVDAECRNKGICVYNNTMSEALCLCEDLKYRDDCAESSSMLIIAIIAGCGIVAVFTLVAVIVFCILRHRRQRKKKMVAKEQFDNAINGVQIGSLKRLKGQLQLQNNICMNPINVTNLDMMDPNKMTYPGFSYTNHDYDLDSPIPVQSGSSQRTPRSFHYAPSVDSGHSSQCTEAVIFRKLQQVDEPNTLRKDKDSGLAGSLNTLCHFDMDNTQNSVDYLQDWGPKVQNLVNVLDLDDIELDEDTPIKEEFV